MISENLRRIRQEIQNSCALVGRDPDEITLVAVTKTVDSETTKKVISLGITDLAENRSDRFLDKKQKIDGFSEVSWHFIGNLQRRKVKSIVNEITYFHALDNLKLAAEIQKRSEQVLKCFVEVNVSGEESKQGLSPAAVPDFIRSLAEYDRLQVVGLMTMAPYDADDEELHKVFSGLRELKEEIQRLALPHAPCTELSMGMSRDFQIAIQEGATFIRIGTALVAE